MPRDVGLEVGEEETSCNSSPVITAERHCSGTAWREFLWWQRLDCVSACVCPSVSESVCVRILMRWIQGVWVGGVGQATWKHGNKMSSESHEMQKSWHTPHAAHWFFMLGGIRNIVQNLCMAGKDVLYSRGSTWVYTVLQCEFIMFQT